MAITRLLQNSAFAPSEMRRLGEAFDAVCRELKLERNDDPLREVVARTVIDFAERRTWDPELLRASVLAAVQHISIDGPPSRTH